MSYTVNEDHSENGFEASKEIKDKDWERKQRNREYRVAARREKRNRKSDEKKQRKLNATILRRMTRNPDKYNKNAERNRLRDIEGERRRIWQEAVRQAQRLAVVHDQSGVTFNVGPVAMQEDGTVISQGTLSRRQEKAQERAAAEQTKEGGSTNGTRTTDEPGDGEALASTSTNSPALRNGINPDRLTYIEAVASQRPPSRLSKTQQKKRAALEPRPPPPKPTIPEGVSIPEGEENWLELWDLPDDQLERRVLRKKKRKAAERKALRLKQKSGKAERRVARDEKRRVYRDIKLTWKAIKEEQTREKTRLKSIEDEESKKIAVDINILERKAALDCCAALGFTLANTLGVDEIKPRALGMKGVEVDFDAIEIGGCRSDVKPKKANSRVNLGDVPDHAKAEYISTAQLSEEREPEDFIKLDVGEGQDLETLNYNHKLRRKLRRAIDNAEIRKEMLVRQRALDHCNEKNIEVPSELRTPYKAINAKGQRILENGTLETAKQERVRARMDLAEYNTQMRVLRRQAKEAAIYAGLRKHAELIGKIASSDPDIKQEEADSDEYEDGHADVMSALENSLPIAAPGAARVRMKRSRAESERSTSSDGGDQSEQDSRALSKNNSNIESSTSTHDTKASKRQRLQNDGSKVSNKQSESTNSDRQVMIDAELALSANKKQRKDAQLPNRFGLLREVDANAERNSGRNGIGKGANSWNVDGLPGDTSRKSKFLRLLGGQKSTMEGSDGSAGLSARSAEYSGHINADLERQYESGLSYKKESKRKGLGS
ncbi:hypothetical protein HO173_013213 [Letharia columbiana]|uniref:Small acidic protein n=1 Tax=Letharia columbiana TaxID=112416 RepID=A0A8H6CHV6_9LECA|nr:uncharacterized protein HO173_013213 [Letharia columbiana]KAF6223787.1 hypothetical protein HO173_013213 [Letharia columbiana]